MQAGLLIDFTHHHFFGNGCMEAATSFVSPTMDERDEGEIRR
jgi:hypothetical protein